MIHEGLQRADLFAPATGSGTPFESERRVATGESCGLVGVGGASEFRAEGVTLILGNYLDYMPIIADAVVTDPPYGHSWAGVNSTAKGGRNWTRRRAEKIIGHDEAFDPAPILALDVPTVMWGANHYASRLPDSPAWLVWDKRGGTAENNLSDCELAWCNVGGSARLKMHMWNGLCRDSEIGVHLHPTQKPVVVMAWAMDKAKIPAGATVLDCFMGSGTTGIACIRTGRKFIGVERDPAHFATAVQRIRAELAQGVLSLGGGGAELVAKDSCDNPKSPNEKLMHSRD